MQRLWDFQKFLVLILFGLLAPNYALAGPSYQDANMEYDFPRPLKIVTKKNPRNITEKMEFRKYDPVVRKHVMFKEAKIK